MTHVLILVCGDMRPLSLVHVAHVETLLEESGIVCAPPTWLHPHVAAEIKVTAVIAEALWVRLREDLGRDGIDLFETTSPHRRKKLLLADMDATIVEGETLDDLAAHVGLKDEISAITARAMRGELDFRAALQERVQKLAGLSARVLDDTVASMKINKGAVTLVSVMRGHGAKCYLVSGGFTFFTAEIAKACGFDGHHGNQLDILNGKLTGQVVPPILDKDTKLKLLYQYRSDMHLSDDETVAVGDGANDIPMLEAAGLGVGYHPKPLVKEKIRNAIVHTDLTSLLYIQGYTWDEISLYSH
jgi:phosphoserine phosphatase